MPITPLTITDLTEASLTGSGVFDVLMRANKEHLEAEYSKNRIKGSEYATVYLGSMEAVLRGAIDFLLQKDKNALEAQLLEQQILLAQVEVQKAEAELALLLLNQQKIPAEIALLEAQAGLVTQQTTNAVTENSVLIAQECKLRAEYDLLLTQNLKASQETSLLAQKVVTEKAQTIGLGVDDNSYIGRQKQLFKAQTDGFTRDAEQKVAKIMVDSWNVRRTTDEGTVADGTNMLNDVAVGRAVNALLSGVGA